MTKSYAGRDASTGSVDDEHGHVDVDEVELADELLGTDATATPDSAEYAMRLGDDALILSQQLGWWISRAPEIEEDVDTLGGLASVLAGHVPQPGEILAHESGWRLEITEGDARRVTRLRLHPPVAVAEEEA